MNEWLIAALALLPVILACLALPPFVEAIDGLVALEVAGTTATAVLLLLAEGLHRQPFADLALIFAVLSFVGSLAFARLLERRL